MKVLVTGCAGFIGCNLTKKLLEQGHEVVGIDKNLKRANVLSTVTKNYTTFTMIWSDIRKIGEFTSMLDDIDVIYHLAASADIKASLKDSYMDLDNNVVGTHSILELARHLDINKIIYSSSSAVYGISKQLPTKENAPLKPISLYGASKAATESFIYAYNYLYGIRSWIFRFANVTGAYQHRGVVYDLYFKLKKNPNHLEILGDGNQIKSFFSVQDCVKGLIEIPKKDNNKKVEVYNLANEDTIKVKDIADIVCKTLNLQPLYVFTGGNGGWLGDVPVTILSIDKAKKVGWKPTLSSKNCIKSTTVWLSVNEELVK